MAIHSSILAWETSWTEAQWATVHGVSKSWTHTIQRMSNKNNNFRRSITIIIAQQVSIHLQSRRPCFNSWVGKICWRRVRLPTPVFLDFPCGSTGKEFACNAGNLGLIPGLGRSLETRKATHTSILAWRIRKEVDVTE